MAIAANQNDWAGDAVSTIMMLESGDKVTCLKWRSSDVLYEGGGVASYNTFAGFLYVQL